MKCAVLHLGDLHIKSGSRVSDYRDRIKSIACAVKGKTHEAKTCICIIAGDIAFSGKREEYDIALELTNILEKEFQGYFENDFEIFALPGNHDCNFESEPIRKRVLETIKHDHPLDSEEFEFLTRQQEDFFFFANKLSGFIKRGEWNRNNIYYNTTIMEGSEGLGLTLLNSSWCSNKKEKAGELFLPIAMIENGFGYKDSINEKIKMIAVHHPFSWMHPQNVRSLRKRVDASFDIILFGHEHESDARMVKDRKGHENNIIDGGVLFGESGTVSGFNLLAIDTENANPCCITFGFDEDNYNIKEDSLITIADKKKKNSITFNFEFEKYLRDPGTNFTHRNKRDLTLQDIFVCPSLQAKDESQKELKKLEDIISFVLQKKQCLITGVDKAGKTSLAKVLCQHFHEKEYLPIIVKSQELLSIRTHTIESAIEKWVLDKYEGKFCSRRYMEQSKEFGILLLDGFNCLETAKKLLDKNGILEKLKTYFKVVILFMGQDTFLDSIRQADSNSQELLKYDHVEMLPFSCLRRNLLIEKWNNLGIEYETDRQLASKLIEVEKIVDQSMGRDLVPSYPLFVLTIVQSLEANIPLSMPTHGTCGSFGYIYEALITRRLIESSGKLHDIETCYNYLAELAYYMYSNSLTELSNSSFSSWHNNYINKFMIHLDENKIVKQLTNATLLEKNYLGIKFKYKYIYCYFVG